MIKGQKKRKVSEGWLERVAVHYLGRYAATEARLRDILERKVMRRNEEGAPPNAEQRGWIDAVVQKCIGYGYVNDGTFAAQRLQSLVRKGKTPRNIAADLRHKGVPADTVEQVLAEAHESAEENLTLQAAAALVRRRRFGAFRSPGRSDEKRPEKELAALMRAGFPYGLAREVLAMEADELIALLP
ncbi:MAG: regulatory protein RecX [Alphaproteobacteria bacterium]|nr:MAG: regulatory protein RecX [Alphaproteobacteria bacterium]